jgi:DNA adenine methylase
MATKSMPSVRQKILPFIESSNAMSSTRLRVVNVASVKHRSPFRYPGGKTWLVPRIRQWLDSRARKPSEFAEVFAGGAIVGLSVIFDDLAQQLTLIEKDEDVAAVWRTILNGKNKELTERIVRFDVSEDAVRSVLAATPATLLDRAFATVVRNRMQHGGIMAPGASLMKSGENGRGLRSRWYADTLRDRILDIGKHKKRIHFISGDGIEYVEANANRTDIVFFIDPPYTVAGRRLYVHSDIEHEKLFRAAAKIKGDFLMTYDSVRPIRELAREHGFDTQEIPMKNSHHTVMNELLIGRNLDWVRVESGDGAGSFSRIASTQTPRASRDSRR